MVLLLVDFKKLNNVVKNWTCYKGVFEELVKRINGIDTSRLVKKTDYDNKMTEIEGKILITNGLTTTATLVAVEKKIPKVGDLLKKADCNAKILDFEKSIFLPVVIINLRVIYLMQRWQSKN